MHCWTRNSLRGVPLKLAEVREVLRGEYGRLCLARIARSVTSGDGDSQIAAEILAENWQRIPSVEQQSYTLLRWADFEKTPASKVEIYHLCLKYFPFSQCAAWARDRLCASLLAQQDADAAAAFIARQEALGEEHLAGLDQALLRLSTFHFEKNDRQSEELLLKIFYDYPETTTASRAMLGLAEVFQQRGDGKQEIAWLRKCIAFGKSEATGAALWIPTIRVPWRSSGWPSVGRSAENGRRRWRCGSHGNPAVSVALAQRRSRTSVRCRSHLGDHGRAAQEAWSGVAGSSLDRSHALSWTLYVLFRDAGQLPELERAAAAQKQATLKRWQSKGYFVKMSEAERELALPTSAPALSSPQGKSRHGLPMRFPSWIGPNLRKAHFPNCLLWRAKSRRRVS